MTDRIEQVQEWLAAIKADTGRVKNVLKDWTKFDEERASGGGFRNPLAARANEILATSSKTTVSDKMDAHNQLAQDHFIARNKAMESGKEDQAKAHDLAGKAHMAAENAWHAVGRNEGGMDTAMQRTQAAAAKTNNAAYLESAQR